MLGILSNVEISSFQVLILGADWASPRLDRIVLLGISISPSREGIDSSPLNRHPI